MATRIFYPYKKHYRDNYNNNDPVLTDSQCKEAVSDFTNPASPQTSFNDLTFVREDSAFTVARLLFWVDQTDLDSMRGKINGITSHYRARMRDYGTITNGYFNHWVMWHNAKNDRENGTEKNFRNCHEWNWHSESKDKNPFTSQSWKWDDLKEDESETSNSNVAFGFGEYCRYSGYYVDVSSFYIEVDYTPAILEDLQDASSTATPNIVASASATRGLSGSAAATATIGGQLDGGSIETVKSVNGTVENVTPVLKFASCSSALSIAAESTDHEIGVGDSAHAVEQRETSALCHVSAEMKLAALAATHDLELINLQEMSRIDCPAIHSCSPAYKITSQRPALSIEKA